MSSVGNNNLPIQVKSGKNTYSEINWITHYKLVELSIFKKIILKIGTFLVN